MRRLSADFIFHDGKLQKGLSVSVDENGRILGVSSAHGEEEFHKGILCPGLINAHCHLELSHLHNVISEGTGMAEFATLVVKLRNTFEPGIAEAKAEEAARSMWKSGISGVGDISNLAFTAPVKSTFKSQGLFFHTFVELIGFFPEQSEEVYHKGLSIFSAFETGTASLSPHAPYSLSPPLFRRIVDYARIAKSRISIHLLESEQERRLFKSLDGPMMDLLNQFNLPFSASRWKSPLDYILSELPNDIPAALLVHNTEMTRKELIQTSEGWPNAFFVLCPRANQYIHSKLPESSMFASIAPDQTCIGTDSLASNYSLNVLEEIKILQQSNPSLTTELLLKWATLNGARALGMESQLGSFIEGKFPGVTWIRRINAENGKLDADSVSQRLI